MTFSIRPAHLLVAGILALLAALPLAQAAQAGPAPPEVPSTRIEPPAGNKVFLVRHAVGVQIYSCNAVAGGFAWGFVAPRADLFDEHGKLTVTHFAGPTWQSKDGSRVVGQRVDGVTINATAIPWLLLSASSTTPGRLGQTTYIQRVATTGGIAPPASECNAESVGDIAEVPYTSDYYFWKKGGPDRG